MLFDTGQVEFDPTQPTVVLRAKPDRLWTRFENLTAIQSFYPDHTALTKAGVSLADKVPSNQSLSIVQITRSKVESLGLIADGLACLSKGGLMIIDGNKSDGIESLLKIVNKELGVEARYSKAHGKCFWLTKSDKAAPISWKKNAEPAQNAEGYWTQAGIFSADATDPGSAFLMEHLPVLTGRVADLGAGWGRLASHILETNPKIDALSLYEAEKLALSAAQRNISDTRAQYHWADVTNIAAPAPFDFVVMNPPFHTERKADQTLGQRFISAAASLVAPKGAVWMVANRQLAYEEHINSLFGRWQIVVENPRYKIIEARGPNQPAMRNSHRARRSLS